MHSRIFENAQVNMENLPRLEDLQYHGLHPSYLRVSYIGNALFYLVLLGGIIFLSTRLDELSWLTYVLLAVWVVVVLIGFWLTYLGFRIQAYALRDRDITFKKGIIFRSVTSIPFNRVQHCEIKQGPIERYFGLKTLEIFTAGGQNSDLTIPGLQPQRAQQLKEFIINRTVLDGSDEQIDQ